MSARSYGTVHRLLHWSTAALVFLTIPVAIAMTSEGFRRIGDLLYITHKGAGVVILIIVVIRLAWRVAIERPGFDHELSAREHRMAQAIHAGLYFLLLAMAVTGYVRTVAGGFPIELLDRLGVPPLIGIDPELARWMSVAHAFLGYALVALIAVHIGAVAHHALVLKNGVAQRMWPPVARGSKDEHDRGSNRSADFDAPEERT